MRSSAFAPRWLTQRLPSEGRRLIVVSGARQTGKTTLARAEYESIRYLNLDDTQLRQSLEALPATEWGRSIGPAVLDEAQKQPSLFEKLKYAFDERAIDFSVLLGSSRILLLDRVRESLAGRCFLYELWPLMASELAAINASLEPPLLQQLLDVEASVTEVLEASPRILIGDDEGRRRRAIEHLSQWGGMPGLLDLGEEDRRQWLRSFQQTYLERDLTDLARLSDLQPFQTLQKLTMLRTGQLLSYSKLARDAGIGATTAKRYLEYLRLSYQVVLLQPWSSNRGTALTKSPKVYWADLGLLRQGLRQWGELSGAQFETLVIAEIRKWVATVQAECDLWFYRTYSGAEVDLLIETPRGLIGVEIKHRERVFDTDLKVLKKLADQLGQSWLGGLVVYGGTELHLMNGDHDCWAMPIHRLLG